MLRETYNAGILGVGASIPEIIRKNDFWDNIPIHSLPRKDKDPFEGIEERRVYPDHTLPSDAEAEAGRNAIEDSGINPDEIDLVIVHSMLQDEIIPGNASLVQHKLGLKNAGAWNMDTCCSTFVTMMITASNLIMAGTFKNVLIIGSVIHSHMLDFSSYMSTYMGDGAGAVLMGRVSEGRGYMTSFCHSDGYYHDAFNIRPGKPVYLKEVHYRPSPVKPIMTIDAEKSREIGHKSLEEMTSFMNITLEKSNLKASDVDLLLTHQPCHWAPDVWRKALGIPEEKSHNSFRYYGNLASATIPVNLLEARQLGKLRDDSILLTASPGAGKNYSIALFRWGR